MKWILALVLVVAAVGCGKDAEPEVGPSQAGDVESTLPKPSPYEQVTHVDDLEPMFTRIAGIAGPGVDAAALAKDIKALKDGETKDWTLHADYEGKHLDLKVIATGSKDKTPLVRFESENEALLKAISGKL